MSEAADLALMRAALDQAHAAAQAAEVPVGAVVAVDGAIVGAGHNRSIIDRDPTAHAEIVALRAAARAVGNHRLTGAVLVSTLEPCLMCCGAAVQARVARLVHAADDPKQGAVSILRAEMARGNVNHRIELARGPCAEEAGELLRSFFESRR
jgi:tRNA(adenine34) deaminase